MNQKITEENLQRRDRKLLALGLIAFLLFSFPLIYKRLYSPKSPKNPSSIGSITYIKNDSRYKQSDSLKWKKSRVNQSIHIGDSLYSGKKSQSRVRLKNHGLVDIDQNSMMTFYRINNVEIPNLASGNFRVTVEKKMKIAIGGKLTEIAGNGSELQVSFTKDNKPRVKLLKGKASLKNSSGKSIVLVTNTFTAINDDPLRQALAKLKERPVSAPKPIDTTQSVPETFTELEPELNPTMQTPAKVHIRPIPVKKTIIYTDRLYDLYETRERALFLRDKRKTLIETKLDISWSASRNYSDVFAQLSGSPNFATITDEFIVKAPAKSHYFTRAHIGKNFYRLSPDGKQWGPTQVLNIIAGSLKTKPPRLKGRSQLNIIEQMALLPIEPQGEKELTNFIVELSENRNFNPQTTKFYWTSKEGLRLPFTEAQTLFVRLRGANTQTELTESSAAIKLEIKKPALPLAPLLTQKEYNIYEDETALLTWKSSARKTLIELIGHNNTNLYTELIDEKHKEISNWAPGKYKVKLSGLDNFGRKSKFASQAIITVNPRPPPSLTKTAVQERNPSAVGNSALKLKTNIPRYLNREYINSKLSLEGSGFTIYSQEQVEQGGQTPTASTVGLRLMNWFGEDGFEVSFKTKVSTVASAQSSEVSPTQFEARWHRRFLLPFSPLSGLGSSQLSFIVGYESYRNPSSDYFISRYDIVKSGLSYTLPLFNQWDAGAEMLYGFNLNQSTKYEMAGFVNYYLKSDWSIGIGYRAHVFEASPYNSPTGAPYREAYSEGSSVLRWSY